MQCESCNTEISSKMKGALKMNACPFCSEQIMPSMKAEQYSNLVEVLEQTTFTNRSDVDSQIRDKVAGLLMSNFLFKRLDLPDAPRDIIVLDDEQTTPPAELARPPITETKVQKVSSTGKPLNTITEDQALRAPSRNVSDAAKAPRQAPQPTSGKGLSVKDYAMMQDQVYTEESDSGVDLSDLAGLTPEEIMTTFPELTAADIEGIKNRAMAKLNQQQAPTVQRGLTGNGIRRATK